MVRAVSRQKLTAEFRACFDDIQSRICGGKSVAL